MTTWNEFYEKYDDWADSTQLKKISSLTDMGTAEQVADCTNYISDTVAEKLVKKAISMGTVFAPKDITTMDGQISEELTSEILEKYMATRRPVSVTEIQNLDALVPDSWLDQLILYNLNLGYRFTPKQIIDLEGYGSEAVLTEALKRCNTPLTANEIEDLEGVVDDTLLRSIDLKQGTHVFDEEEDEDWEEYDDSYDYADTSGKKPGLLSHIGALLVADEIDRRLWRDKKMKSDNYSSWGNRQRKHRIGDRVNVRNQSGTIADLDRNGGYSVDLDDGRYLQGVRESEIKKKGLFG